VVEDGKYIPVDEVTVDDRYLVYSLESHTPDTRHLSSFAQRTKAS
jgi:hypothetical protein